MMNKPRVLVIPSDYFACGTERIMRPYRNIKSDKIDFHVFDIENRLQLQFTEMLLYDAILMQRPTMPEHVTMINELHRFGKKVVIEIDDRLDCVHRDNVAYNVFYPNSPANKVFFECLNLADGFHCSTPEIYDAYILKNKARNGKVFLNAIDFNNPLYQEKTFRETQSYPDEQINIMWSGSTSHWDSMKLAATFLPQIILKNPNTHLIIAGNKEFADVMKLPPDRITFIQGVPTSGFHKIPSHGDIALSPVVPSTFNNGKSELKVLESAIWGIPTVCSPVAPYERFYNTTGACAIAKKNRADKWMREIQKLIDDAQYRKDLGQKAKQAAFEHYNLETINKQREQWWREFFNV